ncbi:MAG: RdgB/HAM1 family non-canonical purine NTP pyrophosphatase [Cyclobacteriaceae bacterium]|nr:RdgB/HAM1 family non-canonical purine NTP pyrophosphatase [Cyclobacteriaceae bacterium]
MQLCFATNNQHKIKEVRALLPATFTLLSLQDIGCAEELAEEQNTIPGNSFQKADYVFRNYGVACFADDSGLEVDSLNGAPGVDSAYYAGPQRSFDDNMNLLLKNLQEHTNRMAQFRTVITLITPDLTQQFEGILRGQILHEKRGTEGFGYDPLFLPDGFTHTLAEMALEDKNKISHRSKAMAKLIQYLTNLG